MKGHELFLVLLLVGIARADLISGQISDDAALRPVSEFPAAPDVRAAPARSERPIRPGDLRDLYLPELDRVLYMPEGTLPRSAAPEEDVFSGASAQQVRALPPLPGSAALFLSAMATLGAYHLVRSARHLHLGAVPAWYHAGGPHQVGHVMALDWELNAPVACCLVPTDRADDQAPMSYAIWSRERRPLAIRDAPSPQAPRAPPSTY